jgi:Zn-dependent protease with chaperone function
MPRPDSLYPPGPRDVPAGLTTPTTAYNLQVLLVLASLLFFLFLYVGLLVLSGALIYLALLFPSPLSMAGAGLCALFFLFLLKGFFKRQRQEKAIQVEITAREHPRLFAFIERLCADTNAPSPHRVFLSPEVNAAVFYNESVFSLFLPTPKNLLLGMGLVNVLNLSEFKAVLAHEFGHFSQNSMKLNAYVYQANRIIADMVYGRDWLDDLLATLRNVDIRIAVFAWAFSGLIWAFRKVLGGFYHLINLLNLSLSRQMEFNADLVAVSVAGSDAIVHALARLDFANSALMQAWDDLRAAADHQLYTTDLFYHQNHAADYLRRVRMEPHLGEPPPVPDDPDVTVEVFEPGDDGVPPMWASHPPNCDREQNAKADYVRCPLDDRSPWLLFDHPEEVRELVTWRFYRGVLQLRRQVLLAEPEGVQAFIDDEHAETTYHARYHGLYDGRFIDPGTPASLAGQARAQPWPEDKLTRVYGKLYGGGLETWMTEHASLEEEYGVLSGLRDGQRVVTGNTFKFRGRRYDLTEVDRLLKKVNRELDEDRQWLSELDRRVFLTHYQMGLGLDGKLARELLTRYEFHLALQKIARNLAVQQSALESTLSFLSGRSRRLSEAEFGEVLNIFREAHVVLTDSLNTADRLLLPALKNMTAGEPLGYFLLDQKMVKGFWPKASSIDGKKVQKFLQQMGEVQDKVRRIHFKSLGGILALQERIGQRWTAEPAGPPVAVLSEEEAPPAITPGPKPLPAHPQEVQPRRQVRPGSGFVP